MSQYIRYPTRGPSGPSTTTNNAIARWSGTDGNTLANSSVLIDNDGAITGAQSLTLAGGSGLTHTAVILGGGDTSILYNAGVLFLGNTAPTAIRIPKLATIGIVNTTATNGTLSTIAPGTSGNVMTSNGSTWVSSAPAGSTAPTVQRFTSGSGTYTTPTSPAPLYIRVRMVGGGGGGGGSGTASTNGGAGGDTTFGNHTAGGGAGGGNAGANTGGNGGTATVGSGGTTVVTAVGGRGFGQFNQSVANGVIPGGSGGSSYFGGAGGGATYNGTAVAGATNTGGGGQGGGSNNTNGVSTGPGGGAGGYVEVIILSPGSSFSYAVGAAGTAGTAGTSGIAGAAGGSGVIIVEEFYQ